MSDKIDVSYVAKLARLELDDATERKLQKDMESVLGYIDTLRELDVSGIEPTAHAASLHNICREDESDSIFSRQEMLSNAPALLDDELIEVPQVLPGEEMS